MVARVQGRREESQDEILRAQLAFSDPKTEVIRWRAGSLRTRRRPWSRRVSRPVDGGDITNLVKLQNSTITERISFLRVVTVCGGTVSSLEELYRESGAHQEDVTDVLRIPHR